MLSTPVLLAASISSTSIFFPSAIPEQDSQTPHGLVEIFVNFSGFMQLNNFAIILAVEVLPTPRTPVKM